MRRITADGEEADGSDDGAASGDGEEGLGAVSLQRPPVVCHPGTLPRLPDTCSPGKASSPEFAASNAWSTVSKTSKVGTNEGEGGGSCGWTGLIQECVETLRVLLHI